MKQTLPQVLKKHTVPLSALAKDFTPEQHQQVSNYVKYYDVLIALKNARLVSGFTQQELADKASLPRTTITKIESGKHNPTLDTLMTIASAMDKQIQVQVV